MQTLNKKSKLGFAVICRSYVKPGMEKDFQNTWQIIANYFITQRGAIGSCMHRTADGMWVAYSRWPDSKTRDASWPGEDAPSIALPQEIREAITTFQNCIDSNRKLPDICMEVENDLFLNT